MKILITGGGSEEKIDNVRSICNFSTGRTSSFLSTFFVEKGFSVSLITSHRSVMPENKNVNVYKYESFSESKNLLEMECKTKNYDIIIHAAAVSDYSPDKIIIDSKEFDAKTVKKIPSGSEVSIKLKKNPKLIDFIKDWTNKQSFVCAFKLTSNASFDERKSAVEKVFLSNKDDSFRPDIVISNDLSEINGFVHPCVIFGKDLQILGKTENLSELAQKIEEIFKTGNKNAFGN